MRSEGKMARLNKILKSNLLLLVLIGGMTACVFVQYAQFRKSEECIHMKLLETSFSYDDAVSCIQKMNEQIDMVFWEEREHSLLMNKTNLHSNECTAILVVGDSRMLFTDQNTLYKGDEQGCLLSSSSAIKLFGSEKVEGLSVLFQGKEYVIRGVLEETQPLILVNAGKTDTISLSYMTSGKRGGNLENKISFLEQQGLRGMIWNFKLLGRSIEVLLWLEGILIIAIFIRALQAEENRFSLLVFRLIFWILVIVCVIKLISIQGWPMKWSDMVQWEQNIKELKMLLHFLIYEKKPFFVAKMLNLYQKMVAEFWILFILLCRGLGKLRKRSLKYNRILIDKEKVEW